MLAVCAGGRGVRPTTTAATSSSSEAGRAARGGVPARQGRGEVGAGATEKPRLRTPGVEPGSHAWEACVMPLHYVRLEVDL